jgi:hypothetical protein
MSAPASGRRGSGKAGWSAAIALRGTAIEYLAQSLGHGCGAWRRLDRAAPQHRYGTDDGLASGLLAEGRCDTAFLERYTVGWLELERYLAGAEDGIAKTAEWAGEICGISPESIRALARDMAASRTMISLAWGIQRAHHGEQPLWMGLALACMLGICTALKWRGRSQRP